MRLFFLVSISLLLIVFLERAQAITRAPRNSNEASLIYWRYLCENQQQTEKTESFSNTNVQIELKCPSQHWLIRSQGGQVIEVVENAN
jgi:hypothetical protein